jgi:hypothetical protein
MTLALLELGLAGALLWAGVKCVKLIPLLAGREEASGECTGSLIAIIGGLIAAKIGSGLLSKIVAGAAGAGAGAATKKVLGRGGSTPEPEPSPEVPVPGIDVNYSTTPGTSGQQELASTVSSAQVLQSSAVFA